MPARSVGKEKTDGSFLPTVSDENAGPDRAALTGRLATLAPPAADVRKGVCHRL